jgi:hypothetical protein
MKTILEKWKDIGFLDDIEETKKEALANCYEEAANFLIESHLVEDTYLMIETYIFPVLHNLGRDTSLTLNPIQLIHELADFLKRPEIVEIFGISANQFDGEAEVLNLFVKEVKEKNQV